MSKTFFDTSVLLAGLIDFGSASVAPQKLLDAVAGGKLGRPQTAWHCCLELYAVSTRLPEEYRLSPAQALELIETQVLAWFRVADLAGPHRRPFLRAAVRDRVAGGRMYDAHIAEIARRSGARTVVTENVRHFTSLLSHGIRVLDSRQAITLLERP